MASSTSIAFEADKPCEPDAPKPSAQRVSLIKRSASAAAAGQPGGDGEQGLGEPRARPRTQSPTRRWGLPKQSSSSTGLSPTSGAILNDRLQELARAAEGTPVVDPTPAITAGVIESKGADIVQYFD